MAAIPAAAPDVEERVGDMHEFQCGHQECSSRFTASDKDYLMAQVAEHLKDAHNVDQATETLLTYLESTCVTTRQG